MFKFKIIGGLQNIAFIMSCVLLRRKCVTAIEVCKDEVSFANS